MEDESGARGVGINHMALEKSPDALAEMADKNMGPTP